MQVSRNSALEEPKLIDIHSQIEFSLKETLKPSENLGYECSSLSSCLVILLKSYPTKSDIVLKRNLHNYLPIVQRKVTRLRLLISGQRKSGLPSVGLNSIIKHSVYIDT